MLNLASVKGAERNQVSTFVYSCTTRKYTGLTAVSDDNSYVTRYINSKTKKRFLV
jgi:hypothetical protein